MKTGHDNKFRQKTRDKATHRTMGLRGLCVPFFWIEMMGKSKSEISYPYPNHPNPNPNPNPNPHPNPLPSLCDLCAK